MKKKIPFVLVLIITSFFISDSIVASDIYNHNYSYSFQNEIKTDISGLKVFPNPVRNYKFKVSSEKGIKTIKVNNILGQISNIDLTKRSNKYFDITLKDRNQGIYLVTVIFEDNSKEVKRIIVNQN